MRTEKSTGLLLILGAIFVIIPYAILTMIFNYPAILREEPGMILTRFHEGGSMLILVWWAFAILGLPLLMGFVLIGQLLKDKIYFIRFATVIGIIAVIAQVIGLLRWVFVVPVLANQYVQTSDVSTKAAATTVFQAVHQFGGVLLGEHIGQLFSIAWTVMITIAFQKLKLMPRWVNLFGYISSLIYFLAQGELFATVIPTFPTWDLAGFLGSTLWLLWLIIVGIRFLKLRVNDSLPPVVE